jgi:hypothetical protein
LLLNPSDPKPSKASTNQPSTGLSLAYSTPLMLVASLRVPTRPMSA